MSSLKVYRGGLVGSGKLVLLNGSVSSRNCTLHTNVAMVYPCTAVSDHENGGCESTASDRQAALRPASRSSAVAKKKKKGKKKSCTLCYPWSFSIRLTQRRRTRDSVHKESGSKGPATARREIRPVRAGRRYSVTLRALEVLRGGNCGRDCNTSLLLRVGR